VVNNRKGNLEENLAGGPIKASKKRLFLVIMLLKDGSWKQRWQNPDMILF